MNNATLGAVQEFTVAAWVRLASFNGSSAYLIGRQAAYPAGWRMSQESPTDDFSFGVGGPSDAGESNFAASGPMVVVGQWYHVAGVFKAGVEQAIFLNGAAVVASPEAATLISDTTAEARDARWLQGQQPQSTTSMASSTTCGSIREPSPTREIAALAAQ